MSGTILPSPAFADPGIPVARAQLIGNRSRPVDRPALLRVKRRRDAAAVDAVVIIADSAGDVPPNKKSRGVGDIRDRVEALSTSGSAPITPAVLAGGQSLDMTCATPAHSESMTLHFRRIDSVPSDVFIDGEVARALLARAVKNRCDDVGAVPLDDDAAHSAHGDKCVPVARRSGSVGTAKQHASTFNADVRLHERREDALRRLFRVFDVMPIPATLHPAASSSTLRGDASREVDFFDGVRLVQRHAGLRDTRGATSRASFVPLSRLAVGRILTPFQRRMDESVWHAFRAGDFAPVFASISEGSDVNFQRPQADLTTALMAAAHHGMERIARSLVRRGALVRLADINGRTAVNFAAERGHSALAALLRDLLAEEEEEIVEWTAARGDTSASRRKHDSGTCGTNESSGATGDVTLNCASGSGAACDYDYDVYVLDTGNRMLDSDPTHTIANAERKTIRTVASVRLEPHLHAPGLAATLAREARGEGRDDGVDSDDDDNLGLYDGNSSVDSEDSNAEDHFANDYPEEENDSDIDSDDLENDSDAVDILPSDSGSIDRGHNILAYDDDDE